MAELTIPVPRFLYGTAWKEDATERLTRLALAAGFRGIDTANQRKHYHEAGVGAAIAAGGVPRSELFLQTKFTFRGGQDHRLPYDPAAPIAKQVEQSFASSLEHLGIEYVDSYVLHGPSQYDGLGPADREAWRAMEALHDAKRARLLGVSNVSAEQLSELLAVARVKPAFVQNRCYARLGWDRAVRDVCAANAIAYQGFSLLTANAPVFSHLTFAGIVRRHQRTVAQVVFRFAMQLGMIPLTGTTSERHMREDLEAFDFKLSDEEVRAVESIAIG